MKTPPLPYLRGALILALLLVVGIFLARGARVQNPSWTGATMGTTYHITLAGTFPRADIQALQEKIEARLELINQQMSFFRADSQITAFNQFRSTQPFAVAPEFAAVCREALRVAGWMQGAFDPTVAPLVKLWGFGPGPVPAHPPDAALILEARQRIGYTNLLITATGALQKKIPDLTLDLGAVAKGYGVDAVAEEIRLAGGHHYLVEIGGEVATRGHNVQGQPWRIGVDRPSARQMPGQALQAVIKLSGQAIATSGNYRQFRTNDQGEVLSHIIDPATGTPVQHTLVAVSVVASNCMLADAAATGLFVMGVRRGMDWVQAQPGLEAYFIEAVRPEEFTEYMTDGFRRLLAGE